MNTIFENKWYELWTCGRCGATYEMEFDGTIDKRLHNCEPQVGIGGLKSAAIPSVGIMRPGRPYQKKGSI